MQMIFKRLLGPAQPQSTCEECFSRLDRYVELELTGGRAPWTAAMDAHLHGCPACREEHDLLLAFAGEQIR
jgi:hypothetical protein